MPRAKQSARYSPRKAFSGFFIGKAHLGIGIGVACLKAILALIGQHLRRLAVVVKAQAQRRRANERMPGAGPTLELHREGGGIRGPVLHQKRSSGAWAPGSRSRSRRTSSSKRLVKALEGGGNCVAFRHVVAEINAVARRGQGLGHRRLEKGQALRRCVEADPRPHGHHGLIVDVANHEPAQAGRPWPRALPEHRFDAKGVVAVFRVRELTENQPRDLIEHPCQPKLGKHAIDAVGRLINVFEKENLISEPDKAFQPGSR